MVEGELPGAEAGLVEQLVAGRGLGSPAARGGAAQQRRQQGRARGAREQRPRGRLAQQPRQALHCDWHAAGRLRRPSAQHTAIVQVPGQCVDLGRLQQTLQLCKQGLLPTCAS